MNKILVAQKKIVENLYVKNGQLSDYFDIPVEQLEIIAAKIYEHVKKDIIDKIEIDFLALGIGDGRLEIPIMQCILKNQKEIVINLDYCDFSEQLLTRLLDHEFIKENERIRIDTANPLVKKDVYDYVHDLKEKKYDIITGFYLFHLLPNWEDVLALILSKFSSEKTCFLFSEEMGDTCWIDNIFFKDDDFEDINRQKDYMPLSPYRETLRKFWKTYHAIRDNRLGKPWIPLLSASNMSLITKCCDVLFESKATFATYWDINGYRLNDFKEFVKKSSQSFYPLNYGMQNQEKEDVYEHLKDCVIKNDDENCKRKEGTKIFIYSKSHSIEYNNIKKAILNQQFLEAITSLSVLPHYYEKTTSGIEAKSNTYAGVLWRNFLKLFTGQKLLFSYYLWEPTPSKIEKGRFIDSLPFSLINFNFSREELNKYIASYCLYDILKPKDFYLLESLLTDFSKTVSLYVTYSEESHDIHNPIVKIKQNFQSKFVIEIECSSDIYQDFLTTDCVVQFVNSIDTLNDTPDIQGQFTIFDFNSTISNVKKEKLEIVNEILSKRDEYTLKLKESSNRSKLKYLALFVAKLSDALKGFNVRLSTEYEEKKIREKKVRGVSKRIIESILIVPIIGRFNDNDSVFTKQIHFCLSDSLRKKSSQDENNFHKKEIGFGGYIMIIPKQEFSFYEDEWYIDNRNKVLNSILNIQSNIDGIQIYSNVLNQDITKQAIKSATAAIMSRNISHNLGSHIMAYLKQYLHSVEDIANRDTLIHLLPKFEEWSKNGGAPIAKELLKIEDETKTKTHIEMPFLVGLGRFISYLQERQDFIATICTDYIPYFASVNFKDFIYDELNPDLRCARHFGEKEIEGKVPDNLLLKYIANSEGVSRELEPVKNGTGETTSMKFKKGNNLKLKFHDFDGIERNHPDLERMRKIDFSLPGGIVGRQAFFSIIENIIRNAAKHGSREKNQNIELTINIFEYDDIKDSAEWKEEYKECVEVKNDELYIITVTDNLKENGNEKTIHKLENAIKEDYIDESGKLTDNSKGIKEVRISAAYLRGISAADEENHNKEVGKREKAPILRVKSVGVENNLQYIFCVQKCKRIAFVTDEHFVTDKQKKHLTKCNNNLKTAHCKLYDVESFGKETKMNYDFIVANTQNIYDKILPVSHSRIIAKDFSSELQNNFKSLLPSENYKDGDIVPVDEYLGKLYLELKLALGNKIDKIIIIDGKTNESSIKSEHIVRYTNDDDAKDKISLHSYAYRAHHDSGSELKYFYKKYIDSNSNFKTNAFNFIESITGGNSTDRLIRKEALNDLWFYSHANAMNARVAIFDERLFTKITGIEQKMLEKETGDNKWWRDILKKYEEIKDVENAKKKLLEELKNKTYPKKDSIEIILDSRLDFDDLKAKCENILKTRKPKSAKTQQAIVFEQKKISFFVCIFDADTGNFEIWGYNNNQSEDGKHYAKYEYLGKIIKKGNDSIKVDISNSMYSEKFDYFSIHQGLLDKIYDKFNIEENKKQEVTKQFFEQFVDKEKYKPVVKVKENSSYEFLPRFIIHSGRSKPSAKDMPQEQPFVQYSAIENAIMDCKYTLIDLLDHAHYER